MNLTIIIPARNEEVCILQTLDELKKKIKVPYNVIVVNDCSQDNTKQIVKQYARTNKNVKIINNKLIQAGFSNAIKLGVEHVKEGVVVIVMADLCDKPETINKMYKKILKGWDVVCGCRYMKGGGKKGGPRIQGLLSAFVCRTLYHLIGIPTKDVSNAFKMYRREILKDIYLNPKSGVEVSMDMVLQAYFQNAKIIDIPTFWTGRTLGKSKFKLLERIPRYFKIYLWAFKNTIRKKMGRKFSKDYV